MMSFRTAFVLLNVLGGAAVLGSYAWGVLSFPALREGMWGGVPDGMRPLYTVNMLLAAAGYFPLTAYILLGLGPDARVGARLEMSVFLWLYAALLLCSALWLPLTIEMLLRPSDLTWAMIRGVLFVTGVSVAALLPAILVATPAGPPALKVAACLGWLPFALQTAVLDALVWPSFFPRG